MNPSKRSSIYIRRNVIKRVKKKGERGEGMVTRLLPFPVAQIHILQSLERIQKDRGNGKSRGYTIARHANSRGERRGGGKGKEAVRDDVQGI